MTGAQEYERFGRWLGAVEAALTERGSAADREAFAWDVTSFARLSCELAALLFGWKNAGWLRWFTAGALLSDPLRHVRARMRSIQLRWSRIVDWQEFSK